MQPIADPALRALLSGRNERLRAVSQELKAELFGIDDVIDRVVDSLPPGTCCRSSSAAP